MAWAYIDFRFDIGPALFCVLITIAIILYMLAKERR